MLPRARCTACVFSSVWHSAAWRYLFGVLDSVLVEGALQGVQGCGVFGRVQGPGVQPAM
jgi:hypothetical protein